MIKKLNVCLIYPGFPPENDLGGGISIYGKMLVDSLISIGIYPTVISRSNHHALRVNSYKKVKIYRVPADNINILTMKKLISFSNKLKRLVKKLEFKYGKFNVIEMVDWGGEATSFLPEYRDKLVIRCHTPGFIAQPFNPSNKPYLNNEILTLEKNVLLNAKYLVASSKLLMTKIETSLNHKLKYKLCPIMGLSDKVYIKNTYRKHFNSKIPMKIICCGRIEERKGFDLIVNAVNKLISDGYNIKLDIYGSSTPLIQNRESADELRRKIKYKNNIKVLGIINHNLLLKTYQQYELCVVPSRFESWSLTGAEAINSGLPTLLSRNTELSQQVLQEGNELIFETGKEDNLIIKLKHIYNYYSNIIEKSHNQIQMINNLSPTKVAHEILKYYQSIN